uniref:Putative secreted protein n=1 Tax=Amblyomma cajennense TaxID=34607 RepID=A0A023FBN1_AMBCJ
MCILLTLKKFFFFLKLLFFHTYFPTTAGGFPISTHDKYVNQKEHRDCKHRKRLKFSATAFYRRGWTASSVVSGVTVKTTHTMTCITGRVNKSRTRFSPLSGEYN